MPEIEIALHYPLDYVTRTWYEHRNRGTYPRAGGYDDQDAQLMDDWHVFDMRLMYKRGELEEQTRTDPDYPDPSEALDWSEL